MAAAAAATPEMPPARTAAPPASASARRRRGRGSQRAARPAPLGAELLLRKRIEDSDRDNGGTIGRAAAVLRKPGEATSAGTRMRYRVGDPGRFTGALP